MGDPSGPIEENGGQNGDVDGPSSLVSMGPPSPLTGCYLLIILGEPHSEQHKDIILQRLVKGFLSWDALQTHVDLEEELNTITVHAPEGEDARHGERLIQYASENLVTEILIHPQYNTLIQCMRNLLSSFTRHRHIIHAGYTFSGNGSWILQDGTFSVSDFAEAFQEHDVQRVLRAYPDTVSMDIHCDSSSGQLWNILPEKNYAKTCKIRINPVDVLESGSDRIKAFIDYLAPMLNPANLNDLLESSDVVGNIRFSHPTLYVFPGGQGDAALFGINGFNMLVDGGFNRKACFWNFARHLDRLDAVLMTRINNSNIQGMSSVIERKYNSHVYPQIGHFFCNIPERRAISSPEENKDKDSLVIDLFDKGQKMISNLKSINLKPQTCYRDIEPMNLYHKVGHGTLDMYVISPGKDSREVKEFIQKWTTNDQKLFAAKDTKDFQFPIQNLVSICALLVWQPANPEDTITRILFPGSTPDYKIMEGLEKIKHLEFMKHPMCTAKKLVPSISTSTITKKVLKSAIIEKSIPEPILPSKTTKAEKDNQTIDNKVKLSQDNKIKESKLIEEQIAEKKGPIKSKPKKVVPKKVDSLDEKQKDDVIENKDKDEEKVDKPEVVINGNETNETEKKDETDVKTKPKKIDQKPKIDSKTSIKSRIDSKPPKSMDKKSIKRDTSEKKEVVKSSPTTTPKKIASDPKLSNGFAKEKEIKSKISSRATKSSPSSTPAKSTKEANNRKVLESKQKAKTVKRELVKTVEKKDEKIERKPISHRTKGISPSRRPPDSPKKSIKPKTEKDNIIRKAKLDKGETTDSSLVSTPSADDALLNKKIIDVITIDDADKQRELDDLKEEQEAVREIEEVFKREEKSKNLDSSLNHREVGKQDSATEAEDDEEYLIIEKEEVEQYTEDSINEQESSIAKEEEMQKHQRDSQESEKKRKSSLQTTEEEVEPKDVIESKIAIEDDDKVIEIIEPEKDDDVQPDSIEEEAVGNQIESEEKDHIKEEVQEIISSAKQIAKIKSDSREEVAKTEENFSPTPEDKLSSTKKTSDTKDELDPLQANKDGEAQNLPESQPFSATVESGATTAPTLPEDERIPLDEIKEDLVVEEKYIKEETKETKEPEIPASSVLQKTYEPLERAVPTKMNFDTTQPHLRDIVKTPDEVADLPVHEEADIETYEGSEEAKDDKKTTEIKTCNDHAKEDIADATTDIESKQKTDKIPNGSVINKEVEELAVPDEVVDDESNKEKQIREEKEEDQASGVLEEKSVFEKTLDKKVEVTGFKEKVSTMAEKVEYAVEDLGKNFENTLKDVTNKDSKSKESTVENGDSIRKDDKLEVAPEEINQVLDQNTELQEGEDLKDLVDKTIDGVSSFIGGVSATITDKVESLVKACEDIIVDSKDINSDKESIGFKEVFDYSHPYGIQSFPTELRETHITTLDSPIADKEKEKLIDLKILDKLPEDLDEEQDDLSGKSVVASFHPDDFKYASFERDDSNLKDIKEEEEDDRSTPRNDQQAYRKESTEISDITNKDTIAVVGTDEQHPPRAVSPREEEVLKIVANVAEVLKSEKDIAEIIPDFSEEELERKLRGASPRLDDENGTVQRMLVTASSEDGGEEIEICPEGTIKFSPASTTPEILSGKATPDVPKEICDVKSESIDAKGDTEDIDVNEKESMENDLEKEDKENSDSSAPDAKTTSVSIDEKEKHELPEKAQTQDSAYEKPSTISKSEIESKLLPDSVSRKESVVSDFDDLIDRRESAFSAFSEKDFTKDESSLDDSRPPSAISHDLNCEKDEDMVIKTLIVDTNDIARPISAQSDNSPEEKSVICKDDKKLKEDEKSPTLSELKVEVSDERRESASSHISDKSGIEISRPDSIISHFSDKSEPELKEKLGSSPDSIASIEVLQMSRPQSTISEKVDTTDKTQTSRPESASSHISDTDKTEDLDTLRAASATSQKNELVDETIKKTDTIISESDTKIQANENLESKPASVTSSNDEKSATDVSDKGVMKEVTSDYRPASVSSYKEDDVTKPESISVTTKTIRPESAVNENLEEKQKNSRPPSANSNISNKEEIEEITHDPRAASVLSSKDEVVRSDSVVSSTHLGVKEDTIEIQQHQSRPESEMSENVETKLEQSRSTSAASHGSNKVGAKEVDPYSRPPSAISASEGKVLTQKESRPPSVASYVSDKDAKEIEHYSRPQSVASKDEKEAARSESVASVKTEKDSRPPSVASHTSDKEVANVIDSDSRPKSSNSEDEKEETRPESVASAKSEQLEEKEVTRPESAASVKIQKDSRPPSVTSHTSDKDVSKVQDHDSCPMSVSSKDEKEETRPESVVSGKSEQTEDKEVARSESAASEKTEKVSRPPSVTSHTSDKEVSKVQDHDSRPMSVSSKDEKEDTRTESETSGKSVQKDIQSRPPSIISHVSDKEDVKEREHHSRPASVASTSKEEKEAARSESAASGKSLEKQKDSRPSSVNSNTSDKEVAKKMEEHSRSMSVTSKDEKEETRPESAASEKSEQKGKDSRPSSVASHISEKEAKEIEHYSRPESVARNEEKEAARPESVASGKSVKDSRPPSVTSHTSDKEVAKMTDHDSTEPSVTNKEEKEKSRPESVASGKSEQTEVKEAARSESAVSGTSDKDSRPPSVTSHTSDKEAAKMTDHDSSEPSVTNKEEKEKSRPESVASGKSEQTEVKEAVRSESAVSGKSDKDSRPPSVASHTSDKNVAKVTDYDSHEPSATSKEEKEEKRPESAASSKSDHTEEKVAPRSESVASGKSAKDSRPPSVTSHTSDKEVAKVTDHDSNEPSVTSKEDKEEKRPESAASRKSDQTEEKVAPRSESALSGKSDKDSRPPSIASHTSDKDVAKVTDDDSNEPSVTSKEEKEEKEETRPESAASRKSDHTEEKVAPRSESVASGKSAKDSRPPSVTSHTSDKEVAKVTDHDSNEPAVTSKEDKEETRPESAAGRKSDQTEEKVAPRSESVASGNSEKDSRPPSVASHTSDKEVAKVAGQDSNEPSVTSKEDKEETRPESAASRKSDHTEEKVTLRSESVASGKSAKDSRPPSVASHTSDKEVAKVAGQDSNEPSVTSKEDKEEMQTESVASGKSPKDSRRPSVTSHTSDKQVANVIDHDSRPTSATSNAEKEETRPESVASVKSEQKYSRPPSVTSHVSEKEVAKDIDHDSRPTSVTSKEEREETRPESVAGGKPEQKREDSRPPSVTSHASDKETTEIVQHPRPVSAASENEIQAARSESEASGKLENNSRPPSVTSHTSDKVVADVMDHVSRPTSVASKGEKEKARPESVASGISEQKEKDSRPSSVTSHVSEKEVAKEIYQDSRPMSVNSTEEKEKTRSESVASRKSEQKEEDSRPPSVTSHTSDKVVANVTDHDSNEPSVTTKEIKEEIRPESVASGKSEQTEEKEVTRPESAASVKTGKDSRPPSVTSHTSDKEVSKVQDNDSRPMSVISKDEKEETRPESVTSAKSEQTEEKEVAPSESAASEKIEKDSRPPSVTSHTSDKDISKVQDRDSRPMSVSSKDEKEDTRTESEASGKSIQKDKESRPPSIISHVSDKEDVKEKEHHSRPESVSNKEEKEAPRPESAASGKSHERQKDSRPPSVNSHTSDTDERKELAHDLRPSSVASKDEKQTSRPNSVASGKLEVKEKDRPPSVTSHVSCKSDKEETQRDSRPPSVTSSKDDDKKGTSKSDSIENLMDGTTITMSHTPEPQNCDVESSRPASQMSRISDALPESSKQACQSDEVVPSRSNSVASHHSVNMENIIRPPSSASRNEDLTDIKSSRRGSASSNVTDDETKKSRPESVSGKTPIHFESQKSHELSRPVSAASNVSENASKVIDHTILDVKSELKPISSQSHSSDNQNEKEKDSRSASLVSLIGGIHDNDIHSSRPESATSFMSEKDFQRPSSAASQASESRIQSRRESAVERCSADDDDEVEIIKVKDSRSKSVSSIMMSSMYKSEGFEPMGTFDEAFEHSKDDNAVSSSSPKPSDLSVLIDDVKKIDGRLSSIKVEDSTISTEKKLSEKMESSSLRESKLHVQVSDAIPSSSLETPQANAESLSGKSTPDVADIENKILLETPSKLVSITERKDDTSIVESKISTETSKHDKVTTKDNDFDHISITEKISKTIELSSEVKSEITSTIKSSTSEVHTKSSTSVSELQPQSVLKDGAANKEVITIKSEFRSYTPSSDDFEIHETNSPRSDISAGHVARVVCGWTGSDDEITNSPLSTTSQAPCSPPLKFTYESEYELQRSSSGVSKKSEFDMDDSQDDMPPEYGSEEVATAIPIHTGYKADPMNTSFYGHLPESEPIPITTTIRTVITKQYDEYASSGPDSSSCVSQDSIKSSSDHRFLDDADLDFEKALEEHRQVRGSDVMSSVTSKYEFSPLKESLQAAEATEFPLDDINKAKLADAKSEQPTTTQVQKSDEQIQKDKVDERVTSWGKPLGLPSPVPVESQTTPKRERKLMISKTKMNNEKNLRKRSESPIKGKKVTPIYMDLTYVPHNGNSYYSHVEFFKRVRARYYVFSGTEPSRDVYNALLEAKQTWEDKELEVTIIPTYDTDVLGYWVSENEDLLAKYHIDLSPSASRCTINLQDHETSCSAYRLEF